MPPKKVYTKKDPISHILDRSDMYVGSKKLRKIQEYVAEKNDEDNYKIFKKEITSSPAILRIFVEILSNAIDNVERSRKAKIPCTTIKVDIDKETGETSVWNDGDVVPVEINEEEKIYNHTLIFGNLLTGSNYNDEEERLISGRNGLGSKATNVFSKKFIVKGLDPHNKKILEQTWTNNMRSVSDPKISETKLKTGYTKVTYFPDFKQFGIDGYTEDIINLYTKYVIDAAMLTKVKVYLNDELLPVNDLLTYSKLYDSISEEHLLIKSSGSEVLITPSGFNEFEAISFINGVYTRLGGQHVESWSETVFRPIVEKFNKKSNKPKVNIGDIKKFFRLFIVSTVVNPEFSSQDKEKLESPAVESSIKTTEINKILKWSVISEIDDMIKMKEMVVLKKSEKKKKGYTKIEGLDPANNAGGKNGYQCSLILCEGLSAKTYAVAGIEKGVYGRSGRDYFGILPLRGKLLNCRNSIPSVIAKNKVITDLIQALGLRHDVDYTDDKNYKTLSYGRVILLTDADCFTYDTSLIIKKDNIVYIKQIDDLFDENINLDTQIIENTEVWSDKGWVNIRAIRRKQTEKQILTINTYSGLVRCTEDHKLLLEDGTEKKANELKIGDKLLRNRRLNFNINKDFENKSFNYLKNIGKKLQCYNISKSYNKDNIVENINNELKYCNNYIPPTIETYNISIEESWVWGLFFADGTCGIYTFKKDRNKQNEQNTKISRLRWKKWIIKHTENVNKFTEIVNKLKLERKKYGEYNTKLRNSKKRLENAIKNSNRNSKEYKEELKRTNFCFSIANNDLSKLEKAKNILKNIYNYDWNIVKCKPSNNQNTPYKLILNGGKNVEDFINKMRLKFYNKNNLKQIPYEILNNSNKIIESFMSGYYDGDGFRWLRDNKNSEGFDILGQVGAQGLCYLCERLGYSYNIKEKKGKNNVFTINISKRFRRFYPGLIKSINKVDYKNNYVYDIETETGRINAGIGNMVQRQCDGLHISSLIMNFFHVLFPTILQREEPYIVSMATPIVRVFNPKGDLLFYDENRFKKFQVEQVKSFKSKYYKGLGTTKPEDVPDTFGLKMIEYNLDENATQTMNKAFHVKFSDARKEWLEKYDPTVSKWCLDDEKEIVNMSISDYLNNELIKFSHNDCKRSIPSLIDGLKESQRKILYAVKKRNLTYNKQSLKVAQLGGYVAEHTNYHHGEQNLYETIIKMANEFPGSNNIPLLYRDGQFGSRINSGKDAASARYIFTKMEPLTPLLFREEDDVLLERVVDDGDIVEPKFYIPILPMILINGCTAGIGTGWSCNVPNYNPLDVINAVKEWLDYDGEVLIKDPDDGTTLSMLTELKPWYRGYEGIIEKQKEKFVSYGNIIKDKNKVEVTELPIGMWTDKFKEFCEDLLVEKQIKSMKNNSSTKKVKFTITETDDGIICNTDTLKLYSYLHITNMVLFDEKERLKKYSIDQIINDFCILRYEYYIKRKNYILKFLDKDLKHSENKARFIQEIIDKKLNIMNIDEEVVVKELEKRGYDKEYKNEDNENIENTNNHGYNYLLKLQVRTFTTNKVKELKDDIVKIKDKINNIKNTSEKQMWMNDLDEFTKEYIKWLDIMNKLDQNDGKGKKVTKPRKKIIE